MKHLYVHQNLSKGGWVPPWLKYQQATRYSWGTQFTVGQRVLEVGCGSGDGCERILNAGASYVTGVDIDVQAINSARQNTASSQIQFKIAKDSILPIPTEDVDVVVAFETIEHVPNDQLFVAELARVLKPGGLLLVTTPNRLVTNPGTEIVDQPKNPLHVREYTQQELGELFLEGFNTLEWYGQTFLTPSIFTLIQTMGHLFPAAGVRTRQVLRICLSLFDTPERHYPQQWIDGREPEVLVVSCRKKQRETHIQEKRNHD